MGRHWNLWYWRKLWTQASRCYCNSTWLRKLAKQQLWSCDGTFGHQRTIVSFSGCLWMECLLGWCIRFLWLQRKHWIESWYHSLSVLKRNVNLRFWFIQLSSLLDMAQILKKEITGWSEIVGVNFVGKMEVTGLNSARQNTAGHNSMGHLSTRSKEL